MDAPMLGWPTRERRHAYIIHSMRQRAYHSLGLSAKTVPGQQRLARVSPTPGRSSNRTINPGCSFGATQVDFGGIV